MRYHTTATGNIPFTAEEEAARDAEEAQAAIDAQISAAKEARSASKLQGVEILGVMCSATREDQSGLLAVARDVEKHRAASVAYPGTVFEFENGNKLTITDENFDTIEVAWSAFRRSFFALP